MKQTATIFSIMILAGSLFTVDLVSSGTAFEEGKTLEKVPVGKNLRLGKGFDYSAYYRVINSRDELAAIWSHMVKADDSLFFPGRGVPPPPKIDFNKYQALWFADHGAHASFVESASLAEDPESGALMISFKVWHSDFGSRKLNLWKTPRATRKII